MRQEFIDKIKENYEDYSKMVQTNFEELKDQSITVKRKNLLERISLLNYHWEQSGLNIDECLLEEAIISVIRDNKDQEIDLGKTNKVLMYISELQYKTYQRLLGVNFKEAKPNDVYILYMDIENKDKYFIKKEIQKEFESKHKTIITYKNPNCNHGWNFERNFYGLQFIRRDFIKEAMYSNQDEAVKQFVKKYQG